MVRLSSTKEITRALSRGRDVSLTSYQLPYGDVFDALERAARRGAHVSVRLEGKPFPDRAGGIARHNRNVVRQLRRCGADARLVDIDGRAPLHEKCLRVDGALYADDVNFARNGTIVRVAGASERSIAHTKCDALALEERLLEKTPSGGTVDIETESIGGSNVYGELRRLAQRGARTRLLVSRHALTPNERYWIDRLERCGVDVRSCDANEKFALTRGHAWIGSANATPPYPEPKTVDWGLTTRSRTLVATLGKRFDTRWRCARPVLRQIEKV